MTPAEILHLAHEGGIRLAAEGDGLLLQADREPDLELVDAIRKYKIEIVALLEDGKHEWAMKQVVAYLTRDLPITAEDVLEVMDERDLQDWRNGELSVETLYELACSVATRRKVEDGNGIALHNLS